MGVTGRGKKGTAVGSEKKATVTEGGKKKSGSRPLPVGVVTGNALWSGRKKDFLLPILRKRKVAQVGRQE